MSRDAREGFVRIEKDSKGTCQADTRRCTLHDTQRTTQPGDCARFASSSGSSSNPRRDRSESTCARTERLPAEELDGWLHESLSRLKSKIGCARTVARLFTVVWMATEEKSQKADRR